MTKIDGSAVAPRVAPQPQAPTDLQEGEREVPLGRGEYGQLAASLQSQLSRNQQAVLVIGAYEVRAGQRGRVIIRNIEGGGAPGTFASALDSAFPGRDASFIMTELGEYVSGEIRPGQEQRIDTRDCYRLGSYTADRALYLHREAVRAYRGGRYQAALELYSNALSHQPEDIFCLEGRILSLSHLGRTEEAMPLMQDLARSCPESFRRNTELGNLARELGVNVPTQILHTVEELLEPTEAEIAKGVDDLLGDGPAVDTLL